MATSAPPARSGTPSSLEEGSVGKAHAGAGAEKQQATHSSLRRRVARVAEGLCEQTGIEPLPVERRTSTGVGNVGFLWASANMNVLSFSSGTLAPLLGLGLVPSLVVIALFSAFCCLFPALISVWGPRTGMRQLVLSRYSWGYYPVACIVVLGTASQIGYCILNSILAGQTLAAASIGGNLSTTVGIVVSVLISLVLSFSGIRVLHLFERYSWLVVLPVFVALTAVAGSGPDGLHIPAEEPALAPRPVLSMGSLLAGYLISWTIMSTDYSLYLEPRTSPTKLFAYVWSGFFFSTTPLFMLGAAFACSAADIPAWSTALETSNGELFLEVFGRGAGARFANVVLALSVIGNVAPTFYSFGLSIMTLPIPRLHALPRFLFPLLATAITMPLAIVGASRFAATLTNFLAVLGYWSVLYVAVLLVEHYYIRRGDYDSYDADAWASPSMLPTGLAALAAAILSLGLQIPFYDQVLFVGPLAERSGDLGFEVGLVLCAILYVPLRIVDKRIFGR